MFQEVDAQAVRQLAEPILAERSAELVELTYHRRGGQLFLRFLVDKVSGVTIHDCTVLNQRIGQALEGAGLMQEDYTLEVSSPGLDRPVASKRDFERAIGEALKMQVADVHGVVRAVNGTLLAVQHEAIVLTTTTGNVTIPLADIRSATKAVRW